MVGLFKVTESRLEGWIFGADFTELMSRIHVMLSTEEDGLGRAELEELIQQLSALTHVPAERTRLTQHFYLVSIAAGPHQPLAPLAAPPAEP